MKPHLLNFWLVLFISLYFTERNLEFCDFFLHWLLSIVKGFVSVMCSAIKSFILLSSFRGINFISLSKQDCLIYFNYWKCQIHETMTIFFLKRFYQGDIILTVLFSISQIVYTKLIITIRIMKMLGKWNQKSGLLTELWIRLSTVKRFNSVAVKPKNSQTCYKRRNIQIFQNSQHFIERTDSSFFERPFLLKRF